MSYQLQCDRPQPNPGLRLPLKLPAAQQLQRVPGVCVSTLDSPRVPGDRLSGIALDERPDDHRSPVPASSAEGCEAAPSDPPNSG